MSASLSRGSSTRRLAPWLIVLGLAWLVGAPLLITLFESLSGDGLATWRDFLSRGDEWQALVRSLWLAVASALGAALLGVPLAFLFAWTDFPGRRLLGTLVALPIALPPLVGVVAFLFLWGESGFVARGLQHLLGLEAPPWRLEGPVAILLVHVYSFFVYYDLFTRAALARFDRSQLEAAAALGAGRLRRLVTVLLPALRPALVGATVLAFLTSLGSFSAPYLFGGSWRVMTTQIVASKLNGQDQLARVESLALATLALASLLVLRWLEGRRTVAASHGVAPARRHQLGPRARWLVCGLATLLAVILLAPHVTLLLLSFVPTGSWAHQALPPVLSLEPWQAVFAEPRRLEPIAHALLWAAAATSLALVIGVAAAWTSARGRGVPARWASRLVAVPWAVPGTVFAIALAAMFSRHEPALGRWLLVGTIWLMPLAWTLRVIPLIGRAAIAGWSQLDPALEEAAASLGRSPGRVFLAITLPLLAPALAAGAGLAFVAAAGDFVTAIVLYTYDNRPISIEMLSALRLQETGVAAVYGVLLSLASGLVFWFTSDRGSAARSRTPNDTVPATSGPATSGPATSGAGIP